MGEYDNLMTLGLIGFGIYLFSRSNTSQESPLGGGSLPPSSDTAASGFFPQYTTPIYPGIKPSFAGSSGTYTLKTSFAARINPRNIPDDVATNPARLIKEVLPGGSGGVISGLFPSQKNLPIPRIATPQQAAANAEKARISKAVNKILTPYWSK